MASVVNKETHAVYAAALNTKELFPTRSMRTCEEYIRLRIDAFRK